ncbi:MAG: hypothetical protein HUN04_04920 [Desulfobacter sp.]|nr:MAG: hypothetical protein HUN04_04920 [Desulfobacter sp.]
MLNAIFLSPILPAVVFTLYESYHMLHRPDMIYIPVLFELLFFGVGYLAYGLANAIIIVPLCMGLTRLTPSPAAGTASSIAMAVIMTVTAYYTGLLGNKPSIIHEAFILGIFVPICLSAMASFYFIAKHRQKPPKKPGTDH